MSGSLRAALMALCLVIAASPVTAQRNDAGGSNTMPAGRRPAQSGAEVTGRQAGRGGTGSTLSIDRGDYDEDDDFAMSRDMMDFMFAERRAERPLLNDWWLGIGNDALWLSDAERAR